MRDAKYYIDHKLKVPQAFFDWCYHDIPVYKWSNKKQTIISSDRKNVCIWEKRLTKNSRLTFNGGFYSRAIVLVTSKRIEIQSYCFWLHIIEGKESLECELVNFERFSDDEHIKITKRGDQYIEVEHLTPNFGGMSGAYTGTQFYQNDWRRRIEEISELKYLDFGYSLPRYWELEHLYKYKTEIEFLQKIHARRLSANVWEGIDVDMRTISQKWLKKNKQYFKNSDRGFASFELVKRIKERRGKVVPGIENYLSYKDIRKVPKGIGITSFQNWVIKNKVDWQFYADYLAMLNKIGVDPTGDTTIAMPKSLNKAHAEAVELYNQILAEEREIREQEWREEHAKQLAEEQERNKEALKVRKNLETEIGAYDFILPKKIGDIVQEGKQMHNCVGTYVERHKSGNTTIVFIRKKEAPEKSFCTMEYRSGEIVQLRAKYNENPPEEVQEVAQRWLGWVNRKRGVK